MTLKECYDALGGGYEEVMDRLRSERLAQKFLLRFPEEGSYGLLCRSMEEGNAEEAFRASHTIKGICANLGLARLGDSAHELTEALRGGPNPAAAPLFEKLKEDYRFTSEIICAFRDSLN